jgi:hypothetical protein
MLRGSLQAQEFQFLYNEDGEFGEILTHSSQDLPGELPDKIPAFHMKKNGRIIFDRSWRHTLRLFMDQ